MGKTVNPSKEGAAPGIKHRDNDIANDSRRVLKHFLPKLTVSIPT
jgi:hypothetical protein